MPNIVDGNDWVSREADETRASGFTHMTLVATSMKSTLIVLETKGNDRDALSYTRSPETETHRSWVTSRHISQITNIRRWIKLNSLVWLISSMTQVFFSGKHHYRISKEEKKWKAVIIIFWIKIFLNVVRFTGHEKVMFKFISFKVTDTFSWSSNNLPLRYCPSPKIEC